MDEEETEDSEDAEMGPKKSSWLGPLLRWLAILLVMAGVAYVSHELGRGARLNDEGVRLDVPEEEAIAPAPQEGGLPALMRDLAAAQACDRIRGRFLPIPADPGEGQAPIPHLAAGRLWVEGCTVEEREGRLHARVSGRGFRYLSRIAEGPFASRFAARGYLRFEAQVGLLADLSFRYEREQRQALTRVTPVGRPEASLRAIGALPVQAEGGWSSVIGSLGGLFGSSVTDRARQVVEEQGSAILAAQARRGATLRFDLCNRQLDVELEGSSADTPRPYPEDGRPWLANGRGLVYPEGLDLLGPFQGLHLDVELLLEEGQGGTATLVCASEARRLAASFLASAGGASPRSTVRQVALRRGQPARITESLAACPEGGALVILPSPRADAPLRYRTRVREPDAETSSLVRCPQQ